MTFLHTLFYATGVLTWYVLLVLAIAKVLGHVSREYPQPYDYDEDDWPEDDDDTRYWNGNAQWPGGAA